MAANDYYNSYNSSQPHRGDHGQHVFSDRLDEHLPPQPSSHPYVSPIMSPAPSSPFADHNSSYPEYPPSSRPPKQQQQPQGYGYAPYSSSQYQNHQPPDPFADQNAIPLQTHAKMDSSPTRYNADPEGRYTSPFAPEKKRRGRSHQQKGWKGYFTGRITWVVYILTVVQIGVFIGEIIKNAMLTGSPIEIHPSFNPMIGPSPYVLINMGARYPPCMHNVEVITDYVYIDNEGRKNKLGLPCPWLTTNTARDTNCTLSQLCGFGGVPYQEPGTKVTDRRHEPNQWWRFIVPMFLHAGLIHIGFNMLLQWTLGRDMEKEIGSIRFALVYFSSGIFGFVLGGNYAAPGISSTGASGSLFGILALTLLDLIYNWSTRRSPVKDLLFLLLDVAIAFVLGLLPGLDNFSHIGGFMMGLVLGICLMHSPPALRERIGTDEPPYTTVDVDSTPLTPGAPAAAPVAPAMKKLVSQPVGFFKGRKPFWWVWWLFRAGCLVAVLIGFILLLKNFYVWRNKCSWCHHLTCLPVKDWCDVGSIKPTVTTSQISSAQPTSTVAPLRRDFLNLGPVAAVPTGAFL
ncbi:rhomboid-domain-containing protein [Delitschia confertaspora ATCC 74209]|uniref:Rhomboid-type serine protease n=1 Tax=Delitschia confertaspora ATCC 74209 TaxID=1513339 RepID=A0A9P4JMA1_9PLEO|nr:rhomboid-domain-containing protein [Delitschia confertaspora ATCC 74209]